MKKVLFFAILGMTLSCTQKEAEQAETVVENLEIYGDTITADGAVPVNTLASLMGDATEKDLKLEATIEEVCQKKGCWMKVDLGDGKTMRVTFKDYAFFVPKDAAGRKVVLDGVAMVEETSVESLRHFAEDAGKSKEEIEAITEGTKEVVFEARGVIIQ